MAWGFHDWIKGKLYNRAHLAKSPEPLRPGASGREIQKVIRGLLRTDHRAQEAYAALLNSGPQVVPHLEAALDDPAYRSAATRDRWQSESALELVVAVLVTLGSERAKREAARLVASADRQERALGIRFCLATGQVAAVASRLVEEYEARLAEGQVAIGYAVGFGIRHAVENGRADAAYVEAIWPVLLAITVRRDRVTSTDVAALLLKLDRDRAARDLTTAKALSLSNAMVADVLSALTEHGVSVEPARLVALIEEAAPRHDQYPESSVIEAALMSLARQRFPGTRAVAERFIDSGGLHGCWKGALRAIEAAEGVHPWKAVFDARERVGHEGLTRSQRLFCVAALLNVEVRNGGFLQYFSNPDGEYAYEALEALREMGLEGCFMAASRAVRVFGREGVSKDRDERNDVLGRLLEHGKDPFDGLDGAWYQEEENFERGLHAFVMRHAEHFTVSDGEPAGGS